MKTDFDQATDDLARRLRATQSPSAAAQARMWANIEHALPSTPPQPGGGGGSFGLAKLAAGVAAAATAAALAWGGGGANERGPAHPAARVVPPPASAPVADLEAASAPPAPRPSASSAAVAMPEPAAQPASVAAPKPRRPAAKALSGPARDEPEEPALPNLERELEGMRSIKRLRKQGEHGKALEAIVDHREQFPDSSFAAERSLLEVLSLCDLERRDDAREKAARFRSRWPGSHLRGQLPPACVGEHAD